MRAKPNEILITRVYNAPVKLVWEAYTDLNHVSKWWGPRGFTITTKSKELKPGGKWIYTMHGPDGVNYPNVTSYHEVIKYEKLVYDHGGDETRDKLFTVTVTFKEDKGKTTMNMIMALDTEEAAKEAKKFIKIANGNSTWDRLGEYLENENSGLVTFIFNRSFDATLEKVVDVWKNPDYAVHAFGPACSSVSIKFTADDTKETRVTVQCELSAQATETERATFRDRKSSFMSDWAQHFEKIDSKLGGA